MDIIERMGQLHSGSARLLVYNLGGDPMQIIDDWQSRIGESVPLAAMFGGESALSLDDAANGAYWDIVEYAKSLYMAPMTRETAVAVANAITLSASSASLTTSSSRTSHSRMRGAKLTLTSPALAATLTLDKETRVMAKTERRYIRLTPELKEKIQAAAEAEGRSISNYVERLITQALKREG